MKDILYSAVVVLFIGAMAFFVYYYLGAEIDPGIPSGAIKI